jgi:hypothetical protein
MAAGFRGTVCHGCIHACVRIFSLEVWGVWKAVEVGGLEFLHKKSLRLARKAPSANRSTSLKVRRLISSTFFAFHEQDLLLIDHIQIVVTT